MLNLLWHPLCDIFKTKKLESTLQTNQYPLISFACPLLCSYIIIDELQWDCNRTCNRKLLTLVNKFSTHQQSQAIIPPSSKVNLHCSDCLFIYLFIYLFSCDNGIVLTLYSPSGHVYVSWRLRRLPTVTYYFLQQVASYPLTTQN